MSRSQIYLPTDELLSIVTRQYSYTYEHKNRFRPVDVYYLFDLIILSLPPIMSCSLTKLEALAYLGCRKFPAEEL